MFSNTSWLRQANSHRQVKLAELFLSTTGSNTGVPGQFDKTDNMIKKDVNGGLWSNALFFTLFQFDFILSENRAPLLSL